MFICLLDIAAWAWISFCPTASFGSNCFPTKNGPSSSKCNFSILLDYFQFSCWVVFSSLVLDGSLYFPAVLSCGAAHWRE